MDKVVLMQEGETVVVVRPIDVSPEEFVSSHPGSKVVLASSLPTREFRDAWTVDGGIDLDKAKNIWRNKIRVVRDKKLKELDIKWMKAMERGDIRVAESIASEKQVLRNLPDREEISRAETLEELKKFWPSVLV
jgi:hypothetical protein